jgi:FtsP/CotA-like multicopper oxidase with cupredoxin domain
MKLLNEAKMINKSLLHVILLLTVILASFPAKSKTIEYDLTIEYKTVNFTGKDVRGMAINDSIPGPTLVMTEGDDLVVRVHNKMDVETSIHWHGLLVPNREDGVPYLTTPPIKPGTTHEFKYPLIQSGTYWYHSHTSLQEQSGVYGSIIIHPKEEKIQVDHDYVLILSDWTDEDPEEVMRTLKRNNEYYALKRDTVQSILGTIQNNGVQEMFSRSLRSIPTPDISDVAYDYFLANGKTEDQLDAKPGDKIRLRIINAATSTYFYLQYAGSQMQVIAADGIDVEPVETDRFLIAIAETYDVILKLPDNNAHEFRATAQDGSGLTSLFIGSGERLLAADVPKPNLYKMIDFEVLPNPYLPGSKMKGKALRVADGRPLAPYEKLKATEDTTLPEDWPYREYTLELTGDMERYVWMINGKTLSASDTIKIKHGENVRFTLVNKTMMHHPMHLHGHFFRVVNQYGDYSPLKHTVDVPPFSKTVIEFAGNEEKDWFFHCHVLYHAKAGMARVIQYEDSKNDPDIEAIRSELYADPWFAWSDAVFVSQMTNGRAELSNTNNILGAVWEWDWDKDYDVEFTYDRYFNRLFRVFAGVNTTADFTHGVAGIRYQLPFRVWTTLWVDTDGEYRVGASRELALTSRLSFVGDIEYDTETKEEWQVAFDYMINKYISLRVQHHSEFDTGAGILIRF